MIELLLMFSVVILSVAVAAIIYIVNFTRTRDIEAIDSPNEAQKLINNKFTEAARRVIEERKRAGESNGLSDDRKHS